MNPEVLADTALVYALGWSLLHFLWQGALIAGALELALAALPRANSSARYAACCAALTSLLVAPLLTLSLTLAAGPTQSRPIGLTGSGTTPTGNYLLLVMVAIWALGSATMTARLGFGLSHLRGRVERAGVVEGPWPQRLAELATRIGLRQRVRLLASSEVDAPLMLGWLRPVILVPFSALTALPPAYVEALIIHELAHARRLDYLVNVLQTGLEAVLFYHPAVHWVSARTRVEREHCCDDIACQLVDSPLEYARALMAMEHLRFPVPQLALSSNGGALLGRIERIIAGQAAAPTRARASLTAMGSIAAAVCLSIAGVWACGTEPDHPLEAALVTTGSPLAAGDPALAIQWLPPGLERWKPALAAAAHQHGLSPALLAIVTLVESMGDPAARGPSGAIGIMQLMPATAARIAALRELDDYSENRLLEPAYNMDFGAWYLSQQLAAFGAGGDDDGATARSIALAAVAYNGGPKLTRAYLDGSRSLPEETERYRNLVVGMWNEREQAHSPTYTAWREELSSTR
jgi:soluble lytic murein transglycosylase-like protein